MSSCHSNNVIAFVGLQGSGKNTAAAALCSYGYTAFSFADAIKDALAAIFCWNREMLEGITAESRRWRETIDPWWAERLAIPGFTPRWAMTHFGTQLMRHQFNDNLWVFNLERRIANTTGRIVLPDVRFPAEIALVRRLQGRLVCIKRGDDPWWLPYGIACAKGNTEYRSILDAAKIHESEWAWLAEEFDAIIHNDRNIIDLQNQVVSLLCQSEQPQPIHHDHPYELCPHIG